MFVKVLTVLLALAALLYLLAPRRPRVQRDPREQPPARVPHAHDLEKCPGCGIWLPAGQSCDCDARA